MLYSPILNTGPSHVLIVVLMQLLAAKPNKPIFMTCFDQDSYLRRWKKMRRLREDFLVSAIQPPSMYNACTLSNRNCCCWCRYILLKWIILIYLSVCTYGYVQGILCGSASNVLKKCNVTDTVLMWLWSVCSTDDEKIEWQMVNTILC